VPLPSGVAFSVCGLGDTSYDKFCQTGKDFDRRIAELGGQRVYDRVDCDTDYEAPFAKWLDGVLTELEREFFGAQISGKGGIAVTEFAVSTIAYGKKNPFPSPLKEKVLLSGRGSEKEVWHHEFSLEGSGLSYEPGTRWP